MTKDEAMKLALEALENSQRFVEASANAKMLHGWGEQLDTAEDAITSLRQAIEQAEKQEPVAWAEEIIADLHALYDSEMIIENDSGDALIRLDAAICAVEEAEQRHTTPPQPEPPPECQTEAEKTAFAFGWFKAMEAQRLAQPEQEPVAWKEDDEVQCPVCKDKGFPWPKCGHITYIERTPPQRTWVGLTDEEITELHHEIKVRLMGTYKTEDIYRAIEAKLKQKNGFEGGA